MFFGKVLEKDPNRIVTIGLTDAGKVRIHDSHANRHGVLAVNFDLCVGMLILVLFEGFGNCLETLVDILCAGGAFTARYGSSGPVKKRKKPRQSLD